MEYSEGYGSIMECSEGYGSIIKYSEGYGSITEYSEVSLGFPQPVKMNERATEWMTYERFKVLTAVTMKVNILKVIKNEGRMFLQNVGNSLPDNTTPHPGRKKNLQEQN
jgi:hypothetical protein